MYTTAELFYSVAKTMEDDRLRQGEHARLARQARLVAGHRSGLSRWLHSLVRAAPAVPDLDAVDPQPEVPADDPWSEAA